MAADVALARSAGSGDALALRRVVQRVAPHVLAAVRSIAGAHHADVEDFVQESLIALVKALPAYRGEATLEQFAKGVAVRRAIDGIRATARARRNASLEQAEDAVTTSEPDIGERRQQAWRALLGELPGEQAEALALRAIEGYSIKEISAAMSVPIETVRSRLRLAKATLRERIARDPSLLELAGTEEP